MENTLQQQNDEKKRLLVFTSEGDFDVQEKEIKISQNGQINKSLETPFIAPSEPNFPNTTKAAFYFDVEDEKDAKSAAEKSGTTNNDSVQYSLQKIAKRIVDDVVIDIIVPELRKRFLDALFSFFKEVRNDVEVKDIFAKPISKGGLGLDFEMARQIIDEARMIKEKIDSKKGSVIMMEDDWLKKESDPSSATEIAPIKQKEEVVINLAKTESITTQISDEARKPSTTDSGYLTPSLVDQTKTELVPAQVPTAQLPIINTGQPLRKTIGDLGKKTMEDVKYIPPKILGPLEEIQEMTVPVFKRLAKDTDDALKKVHDKLELLAKEGIKLYIDGVYAWRKGGVMKQYLEMGYRSLLENKPITTIEQENVGGSASGAPIELTASDFKKINRFNSSIKF